MKHPKLFRRFLALLLCAALFLPTPASAAELYFTSVNDNLLPLSSDTMPVWSGGILYVPYTVFDGRYTGVDLELYCSYSPGDGTISIATLRQMLVFDLNAGTVQDDMTGKTYPARAILRNGTPYLPLNSVCNFFGLSSSYTAIGQGYLVRIKNSAVVLSDSKFIEAASDLINRRVKEYTQSLNPSTDGSPTMPSVPNTPPPAAEDDLPSSVRTYLAFRCGDEQATASILDTLDSSGIFALFLFTPQALQEQSYLLHRILGTGHSIGLLAEGATLSDTRALLDQGNRLLEQLTLTRTCVALVPQDRQASLQEEGWVLWKQTIALSPTAESGANTFASNTVRKLGKQAQSTYLTLEAGPDTSRILPALLRQLSAQHFVVSIPMETRL